MIAVDTNVLVRFLVQDDPAQGAAATRLFQEAEERGERIWIGMVVLVEMVWVLGRLYGIAGEKSLHLVRDLLETPILQIEDEVKVAQALELAQSRRHELPDCLIALSRGGDTPTWTFDRKASRIPGFRLLR